MCNLYNAAVETMYVWSGDGL